MTDKEWSEIERSAEEDARSGNYHTNVSGFKLSAIGGLTQGQQRYLIREAADLRKSYEPLERAGNELEELIGKPQFTEADLIKLKGHVGALGWASLKKMR